MEKVVVTVPGKVILAGEHSVVYGKPAIVAAIDRRLKVRLKAGGSRQVILSEHKDLSLAKYIVRECLRELSRPRFRTKTSESSEPLDFGFELMIESEIPIGGCGSSAALATGIVWALLKNKSEKVKDKVVKMIEDKQHGKSSGVDQTIVREGGVIKFQAGRFFQVPNYDEVRNHRTFILIDSGRPVESTGEMVAGVRERYQVNKSRYDKYFERMGEIAENWTADKIQENQRLLEEIGVVGEKAKEIVRKVESIGGMAKVCGAGGVKKGSGIILTDCKDREGFLRLVTTNKWRAFLVKLGVSGVRYEKN